MCGPASMPAEKEPAMQISKAKLQQGARASWHQQFITIGKALCPTTGNAGSGRIRKRRLGQLGQKPSGDAGRSFGWIALDGFVRRPCLRSFATSENESQ